MSTPLLYLALLWPARHLVSDLFVKEWLYSQMMHDSGVIAVQLLALSLAVTPATVLLARIKVAPRVTRALGRWLLAHRRDFGLASFIYACLHLAHYVRELGDIGSVLAELAFLDIALGWLAFAVFAALAVTSNAASKRRLGRGWKWLHRASYVGAALTLWHWLLFDFFPDDALFWLGVMVALKLVHLALRRFRRAAPAAASGAP